MEREEHVLDVRRLSIRFGSIGVLRDLSFHVAAGTTLAILGPNGAGKTVLFKALIGAVPYEGEIRWKPATRIGYVPQKLDLERDVPITGVDFLRACGR
ncbi:MAG: ATP-binding cassette domain-containing protein [Acidobacteria bacterium]|nr:MAG: ATP-binding cassette domain-containing protein [Acidobacteriota bacterium]